MAEEPDRVSFRDYSSLSSGKDLVVEGGLGKLIASVANGVNIEYGCVVEEVDWSGAGVEVSGTFGRVSARTCIVTSPTAVLADETICFTPRLPSQHQQAFHDLPPGLMNKIGVRLTVPLDDAPRYLLDLDAAQSGNWHTVYFSANRQLATVLVVGDLARSLSAEGDRAMRAFAARRLSDLFGSRFSDGGMITTAWDKDPFSRGSYAHAKVGAANARRIYDQPVGDRLFFAGEASEGALATTVGGAYASGIAASKRAIDAMLGRPIST
jgi:monoamine oxidase